MNGKFVQKKKIVDSQLESSLILGISRKDINVTYVFIDIFMRTLYKV